jgi:hypothetical protein
MQIFKDFPMMTLESELTSILRGTYESALARNYIAVYFIQMLDKYGGVETAKQLLAKMEPQTGLDKLWKLGMLQDSMEAVVLQERFRSLFTAEELAVAYKRLADRDYFK